MAIRFDPTLTAALATELTVRLGGARVTAVFLDRSSHALHLYLREHTLLVRLHGPAMGVALLPASDPPTGHHPLPCTLRRVEAIRDERILVFHLQRVRGRRTRTKVVIELMPNRANALVLDGEEGTIRHLLLPRTEAARPLRVGHPYPGPLRSTRIGAAGKLTLADWTSFLQGLPEANSRGELLRGLAFVSPLNVEALLGFLAEGDIPAAHAFWLTLEGDAELDPVLLQTPKGPQPYPLPLRGTPSHSVSSLLEAFELASQTEGDGPQGAGIVPGELIQRVEAHLKRARKRAATLERELDGSPDPEGLRALGGLLLTRLAQIPRGAAEVELEGFNGEKQSVPLDPALTPQENAARYFDKAGRASRARERIPGLLTDAGTELGRWEELLSRIQAGEVSAGDVADALPHESPGLRPGADGTLSTPYRRYESSGGIEIRVGRGAKHNDDLTFHHSHPDDIWLHARHAAGAHVVLRWTRPDAPPARDLKEAAILAALHSKARTSGSVPVDWTRRKYVRKPRKSPKGAVLIDRAQTLFVEPDPSLLERLAVPD